MPDPLDLLPGWYRLLLSSALTFGVGVGFMSVVVNVLHLVELHPPWLFWIGCALPAVAFAPLVVTLRKASSLLPIVAFSGLMMSVDLALETHLRMAGGVAPWSYGAGSLLGGLSPALRMAVFWLASAFVLGPVCLWITRLLAKPSAQAIKLAAPRFDYPIDQPAATFEQGQALFPDEWTAEPVPRPRHDFSFYVFRALGLAYCGYLLFLCVGLLGSAPWSGVARESLEMDHANPALSVNAFVELFLLINLSFVAAYNRALRFHLSFVLLAGSAVSLVASCVFFALSGPDAPYRWCLLVSVVCDGLLSLFFAWSVYAHRDLAGRFKKDPEFPDFFSLPQRISKYLYRAFAFACAALFIAVLLARFATHDSCAWDVVFGFPDPRVCSTLAEYGVLGVLAWLLSDREELREDLCIGLMQALGLTVALSTLWLLFGAHWLDARAVTRDGQRVGLDWYFATNIVVAGVASSLFVALRKLSYVVDYGVAVLGPSSAHNVMSLHEALHPDAGVVIQDHGAVARSVDRHIGDTRGRMRGLVNAPFWFLEHFAGLLYGLRPAFSTMSPDERLFFLQTFMLRRPQERRRSWLPPVSELVYKLGSAAHALVTLAHYSSLKGRGITGYIPPGARSRLQAPHPLGAPDGSGAAPLPSGPGDAANFAPLDSPAAKPLIAPRVATALAELPLPDEVDFLIVGSGAGGAVMAYRLACEASGAKILVVERGPRFSPVSDFSDDEMEMVRRLYKEGGIQQTKRFDLTILQGECVGGSTVVNNACCVEMPAPVRKIWADDYGLALPGLDQAYASIATDLEIAPLDAAALNPKVAQTFLNAVAAYNTATSAPLIDVPVKTNHRNPVGTGLDNIGDRQIRKRSMLETYLPWAEARGVMIASETTAVSLIAGKNGRRADGVLLQSNMGQLRRVRVRKAIVLSGGVIASSHLLMRSGTAGNVGQHVACNFALPALLQTSQPLDAFDGIQITLGATDQQSRAIFETYFNPPGAFAISVPFYFGRHQAVMGAYRNLVNFGALVGAEANGTIQRAPDLISGRPVSWQLGAQDAAHIKFALTTLVGLAVAANAERIMLPTEPGLDIRATKTNLQRFGSALATYPLKMSDLRLVTAHPQGGNRMASQSSKYGATRVVDEDFRVTDWDNVFVADASLFPTGITVNPQWTIMALSSLAASSVLATV